MTLYTCVLKTVSFFAILLAFHWRMWELFFIPGVEIMGSWKSELRMFWSILEGLKFPKRHFTLHFSHIKILLAFSLMNVLMNAQRCCVSESSLTCVTSVWTLLLSPFSLKLSPCTHYVGLLVACRFFFFYSVRLSARW